MKVKGLMNKFRERVSKWKGGIREFRDNWLGKTSGWVKNTALAAIALTLGAMIANSAVQSPLVYPLALLVSAVLFGLLKLFGLLLWGVNALLSGIVRFKNIELLSALVGEVLVFAMCGMVTLSTASIVAAFIVAIAVSIVLAMLSVACGAIIKNRKRNVLSVTLLCVSLVCTGVMVYFCADDGFSVSDAGDRALPIATRISVPEDEIYGAESVLIDGELGCFKRDFSEYVDGYSGAAKALRDTVLGYPLSEVPLRAKVWYPDADGRYPLVMIIHGNHTLATPSYLGYDYLGSYLARRGYVVVSLDENGLNGYVDMSVANENDARALMLLDAVSMLKTRRSQESVPCLKLIDFSNIALLGHSRGGEAAATAAFFNSCKTYPDSADTPLFYGHSIKTVLAIAPSCDQYMPALRSVELDNVNYFCIHGSSDQDVTTFMAARQYRNTSLAEGRAKGYLYVADANHGQFNTLWGRYDLPFPMKLMLNTADLIEPEVQRELLCRYAHAVLEYTLKDNTAFVPTLKHIAAVDGVPENIYMQAFDEGYEHLADCEEDLRPETASIENARLSAKNASRWRQTTVTDVCSGYDSGGNALLLKWESGSASLMIEGFERSIEGGEFICDIMNLETQEIDITLTLTDRTGKSQTVRLGDYCELYAPISTALTKPDALYGIRDMKTVLSGARVPAHAFDELDCGGITSAEYTFIGENGSVVIDNIGVSHGE